MTVDVPCVTMTSILSRTNSAAISAKRSVRPSAQRYSIVTVRPSIQPSSRSRCTKASVHSLWTEPVFAPRNPITGIADCCARAASGHTTVPPRRVMKSRRLMPTPSQAEAQIFNIQNDSTPGPRGMGKFMLRHRPDRLSTPSRSHRRQPVPCATARPPSALQCLQSQTDLLRMFSRQEFRSCVPLSYKSIRPHNAHAEYLSFSAMVIPFESVRVLCYPTC
jgi:hypothetical protein